MADRTFLSWPFFEEAHGQLASELADWAKSNLTDINHHDLDDACRELVGKLASGNWLKYCAPAPGAGGPKYFDVRSLCLIRETLAYYSGLADFSFAMQGLGSGPITLYGSQQIKNDYLPAVREGKKIAAFALSES
ncbi:MAG: acyl-CoA dehydrogenase, partial [Gammaproteobacteria bacterium]